MRRYEIQFLQTYHFAGIASASVITSSTRSADLMMAFSFQQWRENFQANLLPKLTLSEKATVLETLAASCSSREKEMLFDVWRRCLCVDFVVALPPSLSAAVLCLLDLATLLRCARVCRAWYNVVTDVRQAWVRHSSRLVRVLDQRPVAGPAYQHFLRAVRHVKLLRDSALGRVRVTVPSWVGGAGQDSCRHQLWGCGPDKVCIEWFRKEGWLQVQDGLQMCCIGEGGAVSLLWEETVGGELQGCLAASSSCVLVCGRWRNGLVWRSVASGLVAKVCSDVDLSPIRPTDHVMMCPTCCSVCVAMVREDKGEVQGIYVPFDAQPSWRFHSRLEGALLGAGLRGVWDDVARHQCDVTMSQGSVAVCHGHHMLLQTWSHQFALFHLTCGDKEVGATLLPLYCLQLQPDLLGPLRGGWMRICLSSSGQEAGLVGCGWLVILSVPTLTKLHCVDVRECCHSLGSPMLQCVALGTAFAVLRSGGDTSDIQGGSKFCVISFAGLLVYSCREAPCTVLNAALLDWPAPHGPPTMPLCVCTSAKDSHHAPSDVDVPIH